jgi:hypothetical protein
VAPPNSSERRSFSSELWLKRFTGHLFCGRDYGSSLAGTLARWHATRNDPHATATVEVRLHEHTAATVLEDEAFFAFHHKDVRDYLKGSGDRYGPPGDDSP